MRINWINLIIALCISALLIWLLWTIGIKESQKWFLAAVGGGIVTLGLTGSMGLTMVNPRSGVQVKIILTIMSSVTFAACCVYSFFTFSAQSFCIPVGVFSLLCLASAIRVYFTKE